MSSAPSRAAVRPVVLALSPPAAGLSRDAGSPCLERLGGSRLIERLRVTLLGAGLPEPLVISHAQAAGQLRAVLEGRCTVLTAEDRAAALRLALEHAEEELLLVHDAERALTPAQTVREVMDALAPEVDAVVPVVALTDSVKEVRPEGLRNIDRTTLAGLQSPRLLRRALLGRLLDAHRAAGAPTAPQGRGPARATGFDEIHAALEVGAAVRTVHGSHAGFAVVDRLSLWQAQISLGLARDTSHRHGLARRG